MDRNVESLVELGVIRVVPMFRQCIGKLLSLAITRRTKMQIINSCCRNSGTWGSPNAAKLGPPPVGPPRRRTRQGVKTDRWATPSSPRVSDKRDIDNHG